MSVIFAQLFGAQDLKRFRREHFLSLTFGLLCTVACSGIGFLCLPLLLRVIQTPQALTGYVTAYLAVILLSLPAAFAYNLYGALLRAIGRATAAPRRRRCSWRRISVQESPSACKRRFAAACC